MATSFPSGLDALTNPTSSDGLNSPDHAGQHANVNDAVEALEAKVGVNGSAVTTSLDYMVAASKVVTDKVDPASASTNQVLKFNGTKFVPATGASVTVSDTPPTSPTPQAGDQWYESDTGRQFIYYGTAWVEVGNATDVAGALQPSQVTALSAVTSLTSDDVFPVVDGPSGAVASSKITWGNVQSSITSTGTLSSLAVTGDITRGGVSLPRGIMGAVYRTAGNVAFTASLGDITGMSVTFTAVASRTYKATWTVTGLKDTTNGWCGAFLANSSNTIFCSVYQTGFIVSGGGYVNLSGVTYFSNLTAGSQTLKLRQQTESAGGTILASGANPCVLIIEDIGAA